MHLRILRCRRSADILAASPQLLVSFLLRPAPEHWLRRPWNLVHWWWGTLIMVAAFGNFFYGLWMEDAGLIWYVVPAAIVAAFLIASGLKVCFSAFTVASALICNQASKAKDITALQ